GFAGFLLIGLRAEQLPELAVGKRLGGLVLRRVLLRIRLQRRRDVSVDDRDRDPAAVDAFGDRLRQPICALQLPGRVSARRIAQRRRIACAERRVGEVDRFAVISGAGWGIAEAFGLRGFFLAAL